MVHIAFMACLDDIRLREFCRGACMFGVNAGDLDDCRRRFDAACLQLSTRRRSGKGREAGGEKDGSRRGICRNANGAENDRRCDLGLFEAWLGMVPPPDATLVVKFVL